MERKRLWQVFLGLKKFSIDFDSREVVVFQHPDLGICDAEDEKIKAFEQDKNVVVP